MAKKHRGGPGYHGRPAPTREVRQRFFIFCEGRKTETSYFESFRTPPVVVRVEHGGSDPLRLVNEAIQRRDNERAKDPRPRLWDGQNQVWCVFDRDDVQPERFDRALREAARAGVRVAYSNPAFELWFLLHYETCGGGLPRPEYGERLSRHLARPYQKNDARLYGELEARQAEAIARAERLLATYDSHRPVDDNPSTTVHLLVGELRRFSRP